METINPATGIRIACWEDTTEKEVASGMEISFQAFLSWSRVSLAERSEKMHRLAALLLAEREQYGRLITTEMGKPIQAAIAEIEKCAWLCNHFADSATDYLAPRTIDTQLSRSLVLYRPLGTVFAIMPWNFPFWQVFRFAVPALMAGNSAVMKPAAVTVGCGKEIEKIFLAAGFPAGLFQTFILDNIRAEALIGHPRVSAVTFTGSDRAGRVIGQAAGRALKKAVLELGGSDPFIVLEDADIDQAATAAVASRLNNAGQVCIAAKRLLAVSPIREAFQQAVLNRLRDWPMGDPLDPSTRLGPLAREDLQQILHRQIQQSVAMGAVCLCGGELPPGPGFYYPPTVLTGVKKGMPAHDEELFGPVLTFIDVKDEADAIAVANDTAYGLAACVFTRNVARGERIAADEIQAGTVFVNDVVRSDPRLPFGGIRNSGFGRELGREGIHEFVNVKTVGVK